MKFVKTKLNGAYTIELDRIKDERGFFARTFCIDEFADMGIVFTPVQENHSYNKNKHTLRGMHYQASPYSEAKILRCTRGSIYDVIIDIRPESKTYLKWAGFTLSHQNYRMLYVPEGFAHGFLTLEDHTEVHYLMSEFYKPKAGRGISWDDPVFSIDWPAQPKLMSEKDKNWKPFNSA